jgi:hypothetical protein
VGGVHPQRRVQVARTAVDLSRFDAMSSHRTRAQETGFP